MAIRIVEEVIEYSDPPPCKTAAQMEEICCTATAPLPCCEDVDKEWPGYSDEDIWDHLGLMLDDQGRDSQGRYVVIERAPRNQPCGEQVTEYDITAKNCCEEVAPLVLDKNLSVEMIADMSSGIIVVTGGRLPFNVSVRGSGFYLDEQNSRDGVVYGRNIQIFTSTACGACRIVISDGCSQLECTVRSINGKWIILWECSGGYHWAAWDGLENIFPGGYPGWNASKLVELTDRIQGLYALQYWDYWTQRYNDVPSPGVLRSVKYVTAPNYYTSCSRYGVVNQLEPTNRFAIPVVNGEHGNSTVTVCGSGVPTYNAYIINSPLRVMEWVC